MKIYEIFDEENNMSVGTLIYYVKSRTFDIELAEGLDEWTAPLLFAGLVKEGIVSIPRDLSATWVRERIIPAGRQNISSILNNCRLKEYDEMKLLEASQGRCSQDGLVIKRQSELPDYVKERMAKNLCDCFLQDKNTIIVIFNDDTVKMIDLKDLLNISDMDKVIKNDKLKASVKLTPGGFAITFNDSIDVSARVLYEKGIRLPITKQTFIAFARNNILDTTESCELLGCSRQNLSYLVNEQIIDTVKSTGKSNLYFKGEVLKGLW